MPENCQLPIVQTGEDVVHTWDDTLRKVSPGLSVVEVQIFRTTSEVLLIVNRMTMDPELRNH